MQGARDRVALIVTQQKTNRRPRNYGEVDRLAGHLFLTRLAESRRVLLIHIIALLRYMVGGEPVEVTEDNQLRLSAAGESTVCPKTTYPLRGPDVHARAA